MAITRAQMRRQLYRGGGIASVPRRQRYGLGSKWQDFKDKTIDRVRKIIPNEIANVATKAAPFVAPFNPLAAGLMRGFGRLDQRGDLGDALKQGLLTTGLGAGARYLGGAAPMGGGITEFSSPIQPGGPIANMYSGITGGKDAAAAKYGTEAGFLKSGAGGGGGGKKRFLEKFGPVGEFLQKGKDKFGEMGMLGQMGTIFAGGTGVALLADKLAGPKQDDETVGEYMARRKSSVAEYLKFYYKRTNPLAGEQEVDEFVTANTREYSAQGGRVGYANGTPEIPENLPTDDYLKELEKFLKEKREREKRIMMAPTQEAASGGRIGYNMGSPREELDAGAQSITYEGNMNPNTQMASDPNPEAEWRQIYDNYKQESIQQGKEYIDFEEFIEMHRDISRSPQQDSGIMQAAKGGRVKYNMGTGSMGLPGAPRMAPDGIEYDMRENGGFQPLGAKEGKDDVKAVLAKNEFVMTADAVRAAGGGSIQKGAQRMYDTMKRLESRVA